MLTKCKECGLQISTKAIFCPHCGNPIKPDKIYHTSKRQRLPNGFGQITKLKGNLRKPYRAMITVGKTEFGKPIQKLLKPISYFSTYEQAYVALTNNAKSPYDIMKDITCLELYSKWSEEYFPKISASTVSQYTTAWNHCKYLWTRKFAELRVADLKQAIYQEGFTAPMSRMIKFLFNKMYDYAIENEIIEKNLCRMIKGNPKLVNQKHHIAFTADEISTLWKHVDNLYVTWILIQCYTGMRPNELCSIKLANINLAENYIVGGSKTEAGKNRIIPIHPGIKDLIENQISISKSFNSDSFLVNKDGNAINYRIYRIGFNNICSEYNLNKDHKPHDPRKYFVTTAKKAGVDEYAIKLIVGHAIEDITERVYTERDFSWLYEQMCKITI